MELSTSTLTTALIGIILFVVLVKLYAILIPEAQSAGTTLQTTNAPLSSLFASNGVVILIIMAALIFVVVKAFL